MVYFIQKVGGGPLKIGYSADVDYRRKQLEKKYKCPLAVLAVIPGDKKREAEIHAQFGHLRMGRKEQFQPAQEIFDFIGRPLLVGANPETVEAMEGEDRIKPIIATLRGSPEFKEWLEYVAKVDRLSVTAFLERAAVRYARFLGMTGEIPDR